MFNSIHETFIIYLFPHGYYLTDWLMIAKSDKYGRTEGVISVLHRVEELMECLDFITKLTKCIIYFLDGVG